MSNAYGGSSVRGPRARRRSRSVLAALALVVLAAYPSLADTPETGSEPFPFLQELLGSLLASLGCAVPA
jgi:hypothetical protein